jgi:hypothetical protein
VPKVNPQTLNLNVLGRTVTAINLEPGTRDWIRSWWEHSRYDGYLRSDYVVQIIRDETVTAETPNQFETPLSIRDIPLDAHAGVNEIWITGQTCLIKALFDQSKCVVRYSGSDSLELNAALDHMIAESMTASGLLPLHASVAARNGKATAFLGPSGRGKTTTLLYALKNGWQPVSEDFSWLDPESMMVFGWGDRMRLLPDSYQLLCSWYPSIESKSIDRKKYTVLYSDFGLEVLPAKLEQIIWLERDSEKNSCLNSLSNTQAVMSLWVSTGLPLNKASYFPVNKVISQIISQLDCKNLLLGGEKPFSDVQFN